MSDSFVDLLLVRLGKEEEKKKVLKLLLANLDLSVTEAENAVNNSPSVIKEALPMNEARVIQKDLYPYIDLLPRLEDGAATDNQDTPEHQGAEQTPEEIPEIAEDSAEEYVEPDTAEDKLDTEDESPDQFEDYEPIETTSASEEILSTNRCHICGRTPTDGEKLAPCRTCASLTCRDCFDRTAHVCNHCAKDGKTVDRANKGIEGSYEDGLEFDAEEPADEDIDSKSPLSMIIPFVVFVLALAAVFYFLDPMNIFSSDQTDIETMATDTVETLLGDSTGLVDSLGVDSSYVAAIDEDTTYSLIDTLIVEDPFGVYLATVHESVTPIESPVAFRTTVPRSVDASIPSETSEIIFDQIALIASSIPVLVDDGVFLVYDDTTSVLILVLQHPEEAGVRIKLMQDVAGWLIPTEIDQLVLIYKENRYQEAILFSLVKEAFPDVEGILSPRQFQGVLGYREDCWESISGPVTQWLTTME